MKKKIGFVLDMDGTLVDSTGIVTRIQENIRERFNIKVSEEREKELEAFAEGMFQEDYSKRLAIKIMWSLMKEVNLSFSQRLKALIMAAKQYLDEVKNLKLFDGVEELFEFFDSNSINYVIVTSSGEKDVEKYLSNYQQFYKKHKHKFITKDSVENLKPHLEAFHKAQEILKVPKERIIVVGDTKYDIMFGKAAGVLTIAVLTGLTKQHLLEKQDPDFILDSVAQIPSIMDNLEDKLN